MIIRAAGICILSKQNRVLLLKRGAGSDNPGEWCFPGGRIEDDERAIDTAIRECDEETGGFKAPRDKLVEWTRRIAPRETTGALPTPAPAGPRAPLEVLEVAAQPVLDTPPEAIQLPGDEVDFTTFLLKDVAEFTPDELKSGEHVAHAWVPVDQPPEPLHPGCRIALARFTMNELGVATAMVEGQLTSPQTYGTFTMFNIRITGTGVAYRHRKLGEKATAKDRKAGSAIDANGYLITRDEEYVYRNPGDYLTDEFLQRCNGLPVIMQHPRVKNSVDSAEFNMRTVGFVFKPFIRGNEVWAVCKIYDEDAIELITENQLSTSPGVVWRDASANVKTVIDGHNFLLENKPSLMDHIAVCPQGVWDKGGPPVGIETVEARKDSIDMDDKELKAQLEAQNKINEENGAAIKTLLGASEATTAVLGKIMSRFDADDKEKEESAKDKARKDAEEMSFSKRNDGESDDDFKKRHDTEEEAMMDAWKACGMDDDAAMKKAADSRKDAEESEEKARKDAEDKAEEEKARKDASALATENKELKKRLDDLEKRVPTEAPRDADFAQFAKCISRFDEVYSALGENTPKPFQHESLLAYRKRGVIDLKKHSKTWKAAEINIAAADEALFTPIENQVIGEALAMARSDATVPAGTIRQVEETLPTGHKSTKFFGNPADWMSDFAPNLRFAAIQRHNANGHRPSGAA